MKSMLKYIFSIALLAISILGNAQEKDTTVISYPERYGLRVGVDLHRLSKSFYEKEYKGLEIIGDYRLTQRFYLAGELGNEDKTVDDDRLNFTTNGTYFKAGFDFNSFENWLDMENMIYVGMRYGVSSFSQTLNSYKIYEPNNFYLGFSLRLNYLVSNKKPSNFDNLYIPGFNRTYDGKFGTGLNYTLSYFIPIYKKNKSHSKSEKL